MSADSRQLRELSALAGVLASRLRWIEEAELAEQASRIRAALDGRLEAAHEPAHGEAV